MTPLHEHPVLDHSARLAPHYSRFRVSERLLLTGHSHQAWPDVALAGQIDAFMDAARDADDKWERAFKQADQVRAGLRRFLGDPHARLALGASTHDLVLRFLSALDLRRRPRLVTTDGEFHTLRRQLARLAEEGVELTVVPARPAGTLAARLARTVNDRTAAVLVSAVLFEDARIVPGLDELAASCLRHGAELLVDAYHALGAMPFRAAGIPSAWVVGGGYKYLQLGEGNCFLRLPEHADRLRPVITGWFAEFGGLAAGPPGSRRSGWVTGEQRSGGRGSERRVGGLGGERRGGGLVGYPDGAARFAGSTYDPTSHYRAARVLGFFDEQGLTPEFLRAVSLRQVGLLAARFDALDVPGPLVTRDRSGRPEDFGGFLALRSPHAGRLRAGLAARGVQADSRGEYLRLGPAPYLSDAQLEQAADLLAEEIRDLMGGTGPRP